MNKEELEIYFKEHNYPSYERSKYDKYLNDEGFVFDVPSIHITGTSGAANRFNLASPKFNSAF